MDKYPDITNPVEYLTYWSNEYKRQLMSDILPFWMKYGLDKENGGVFTCLDRNGIVIDRTKSVWFQGRFAYILAYAYNHFDKNTDWLDASRSCIEFIEKHCFDNDGRMFFEVTAEGVPVRKRRYAFSETFAAIAMAQYSIASGDGKYAEKALSLFEMICHYYKNPDPSEAKFREGLKAKGHSLCMILIDTASCIREAIDHPLLTQRINESIEELQKDFIHPEFSCILETVGHNGEFIDSIAGRTINPGHSIETAWFIMKESMYRGNDKELSSLGLKILDWSWEWGWDKANGGISYFKDCKDLPPQDYWHDMKFWWPQCEAIIATLMAYKITGDIKYLQMHKQINDYAFSHFPDPDFGEWVGYLHNDGTVSQYAKGNIFKGPFHIPRMLMQSHLLCESILDS